MSLAFHHSIKGNQKNERFRHLFVFDVESHIDKHDKNKTIFEPFLWCAIYSRYRNEQERWIDEKHYGTNIDDFWDLVESYAYNKEKLVMSSHHLEPDIIPLEIIQRLHARGWQLQKYITHNKILMFDFIKDKRKIVVTNSGNIFPGSIADWGKALKLDKLEMPTHKEIDKEWIDYCMRDCEVLLAMWHTYIEFLDNHDMGNLKFTAASQAMTTFRHRFMNVSIAIHQHTETLALERLAYHGGRFQALQIGNIKTSPVWRLDINSMYGELMMNKELPYELRGYQATCKKDKLQWLINRYAVIAEMTIRTFQPVFPIIVDEKVTYPIGKIHGYFCTPEIEYILDNCSIISIGQISWYRKDKILSAYATYFLGLRQEYKKDGNKPYELLAKLFVNSLYGKFGQYGYKEEIIGECSDDTIRFEQSYNKDTNQNVGYLMYGGKIHIVQKENNSYNTFVAIAAHITAYGRIALYKLIEKAGINNVYHVATDSLIVNREGLNNLHDDLDNMVIGKLKIEEEVQQLIIKAPNDMVLDTHEKIKGISKKAIKHDDNTYTVTCWPSFNAMMRRNELGYYYTKSITKRLKRTEYLSLDNQGNQVKVIYAV